jgi:hypothetical protein
MPSVLKEQGIKVADLASNVVVNFNGEKNKENISFNTKGVASVKNLAPGNYQMALANKPPKGPNGPSGPPRGKCPPGETPWLGGCIPIVVVSKVQADVWAICCRQGNKACCDMAPKPSIEATTVAKGANKAVDINCPSGKYDANGNCIFGPTNATDNGGNTAERIVFPKPGPFGIFSIDAGYLGSSNAKNINDKKPLFAGNGLSVGLNYRYGSKLGVTGRVGYTGGSRNESNLKEFASKFNTGPWVYKTTGFTKSWSQFNFAAGPSIFLGKKYKGEISIIGGVSMGSESNIKIDLYDANTYYKTVYDVTEKKVKTYWEVKGSYQLLNVKKIGIGLKGSYGSNGVSVGIVAWDWMACCAVKCKACPGLIPSKIIEN